MVVWRIKAMNTEQIDSFVAIANKNSYQKAADSLHVYPQKVKYYIKTLEDELQIKLTKIKKGHTVLTLDGKTLLPLFYKMQETYGEIRNLASQHPFTIGIDNSYPTSYPIIDLLLNLSQTTKKPIALNHSFSRRNFPVALNNRTIDCFFSYPRWDDNISFIKLFDDQIMLTVPHDGFIHKKVLSYSDLSGFTLVCEDPQEYKAHILFDELIKSGTPFKTKAVPDIIALMPDFEKEKCGIIQYKSFLLALPFSYTYPISDLSIPFGICYRKDDGYSQSFIRNVLLPTFNNS